MNQRRSSWLTKITLFIISFFSIMCAMAENNDTSKIICTRTLLKKGVVDEVRQWLAALESRKDEVLKTFQDEGVWLESAFLEKSGEEDYLVYYMRADDVMQAIAVFQKSVYPIDQFHRECWGKYAENTTVLEPIFHLERKKETARPEDVLVDVIALSRTCCAYPIEGFLAYATNENFLGRVVDGYVPSAARVCLLTQKAAMQLCSVQNALNKQGLGLFIFDAFRPLRAVRDFSQWYRQPPVNAYEMERKELHFPHLEKTDLVRLGYAPETVSRHCYGHAVDVSLMDLASGKLLDMGTIFDYFGAASHHPETSAEVIGQEAYRNRELLSLAMQAFGFVPYPLEYWHFDYQEKELEEPADLEIAPSLAGINVSKNT